MKSALTKASAFCARFGLKLPILLAPMAGASAPSLSIAVANAGGLGACGALLMQPAAILSWAAEVRAGTNGAFQLNLWVPDPKPFRDPEHEARVRDFLAGWGPLVLQLRMLATAVVRLSGTSLVMPSPSGPGDYEGKLGNRVEHQACEQSTDFRNAEYACCNQAQAARATGLLSFTLLPAACRS